MSMSLCGPSSVPDAQGALPARSAAEAQMYLDLHPCACGAPRSRARQELQAAGDSGLRSVYAGICPGCGRPWSVAFTLPDSPPPPDRIGEGTSAIIDPAEWLLLSDQAAAGSVAGTLTVQGRARLLEAADAAAEALKFVPPGSDCVPAGAFTSSAGRVLRDSCPERFTRDSLLARCQVYMAGAADAGGYS